MAPNLIVSCVKRCGYSALQKLAGFVCFSDQRAVREQLSDDRCVCWQT